mmetsp:Transcript_23379/g.37618  ORF Transcript_23379/g.37618 Transcript_23379/m.37618 type:complete len:146 (+) Transcript_23379:8-445(+)
MNVAESKTTEKATIDSRKELAPTKSFFLPGGSSAERNSSQVCLRACLLACLLCLGIRSLETVCNQCAVCDTVRREPRLLRRREESVWIIPGLGSEEEVPIARSSELHEGHGCGCFALLSYRFLRNVTTKVTASFSKPDDAISTVG